MFAYQRKIIRNQLFLITTIALLFHVGFSLNNITYGQHVVDTTNRTVSPDPAPENDAIVAIPAPSADDFSPETEQQTGTKEKVLENSDGTVERAEIQRDKVSESDQTSVDRQAQVSEDEKKDDDSDARDDVNDNDAENDNDDEADDVPFELPFP
jgi:hypothetical protein